MHRLHAPSGMRIPAAAAAASPRLPWESVLDCSATFRLRSLLPPMRARPCILSRTAPRCVVVLVLAFIRFACFDVLFVAWAMLPRCENSAQSDRETTVAERRINDSSVCRCRPEWKHAKECKHASTVRCEGPPRAGPHSNSTAHTTDERDKEKESDKRHTNKRAMARKRGGGAM
jgi:hypothetical protein